MNDTAINIRPALQTDVADIVACVEDAYHHYIERIGKKPGPMLEDYAEVISKHQAYVADVQGNIAGIVVLIRRTGGILLDNVAVHSDFQGRGIGSQLIHFAEDSARRQGYSAIELYTHELMTENHEAYLKLGYIETDRRKVKGFARIYMQKDLT